MKDEGDQRKESTKPPLTLFLILSPFVCTTGDTPLWWVKNYVLFFKFLNFKGVEKLPFIIRIFYIFLYFNIHILGTIIVL